MTDKHTPGPWEATNLDDDNYFPSVFIGPELRYYGSKAKFRDSIVVNVGSTPENVKAGEGGGTTSETASANARLIALAPEMANELRRWLFDFPLANRAKTTRSLIDRINTKGGE